MYSVECYPTLLDLWSWPEAMDTFGTVLHLVGTTMD